MKRVLCFVFAFLMIASCACAEQLGNVYKSENFIVYPLPGYIKSEKNGMTVYSKGSATIGIMEIEYEKYAFEDLVRMYDILIVGFVSGMQDDETSLGYVDEVDFDYYSAKIVEVSKKAYKMYVTLIPGPGCVLALTFLDAKSSRPVHDFENFLYGVVPNV